MTQAESLPDAAARGIPASSVNAAMVTRLSPSPPAALAAGSYALRVPHTAGRRPGRTRRTSVGVLRRAGGCYLGCPDRTRDWARSLLANPGCLVRARTAPDRYQAVAAGGSEAVETTGTYLPVVRAPWAQTAFGLGENPGRDQVRAALRRMVVVHLKPGGDEGLAAR